MEIKKLQLKNFRNHTNLTVEFNKNTTLIIGPNGIGKTNILEAIHLLATTKSMRASYDVEMIQHDKQMAMIIANTEDEEEKTKMELAIIDTDTSKNSSIKQAKINGVKKSMNKFSGNLNSVLFSPSDIEIFSASPSNRRKYLDSIFFQIDDEYKKAHRDYTKAMRARNKLLEKIREIGKGRDLIELWDKKIIETGAKLQNRRSDLASFINEKISDYTELINGENTKVKFNYEKNLISQTTIDAIKGKEIAAARTLVGPHRDDFSLILNDFDVGAYGSRGQQRAVILALKLCEIDFIFSNKDVRPILLLDDIFSELDEKHKEAVANIIDLQQTIITSAEDIPIKEDIEVINLS